MIAGSVARTRPIASGTDSMASTHGQAVGERQVAEPAEVQGQQGQHGDLRRERLGAGDADLGAGVQVDPAVGLAGDRAADGVDDRQRRDAPAASPRGAPRGCRPSRPTGSGRRRACDRRAGRCGSGTRWRTRPRPAGGPAARSGTRRPAPRASSCRRRRRRRGGRGGAGAAVRFRPPNCAVASARRSRPRQASRTVSGCSWISFCM